MEIDKENVLKPRAINANQENVEVGPQVGSEKKRNYFTICIEGNVGCGKSTLLSELERLPYVETIPEPLDEWTSLGDSNPLGLVYEDPSRWGYTFTTLAMLTNVRGHNHVPKTPVKVMERSIHSQRYVFAENHGNLITTMEYQLLDKMYKQFSASNYLSVDLFIYLRASPEVCIDRIQKRNRKEESPATIELIKNLHEKYEDWLYRKTVSVPGSSVLVVDAEKDVETVRKMCSNNLVAMYRQNATKISL